MTSQFNEPLGIASPVLIDTTGIVHIRGRNDMPTNQKLGIRIIVKDPDDDVIEDYEDWEFGATDPHDTHHFKSPPFELYKEGTYTIEANLLMNQDSPVIVDSYSGALCTVATEVPPEPPPEEVPPEINWLPIILIGGGVALAAIFLMPKKAKT